MCHRQPTAIIRLRRQQAQRRQIKQERVLAQRLPLQVTRRARAMGHQITTKQERRREHPIPLETPARRLLEHLRPLCRQDQQRKQRETASKAAQASSTEGKAVILS